MLTNAPPITFLVTDNRAAAKEFYGSILGLKLLNEEPGTLVWDMNGTVLRMSVLPKLNPAPYTVLGWLVADIRKVCRDLQGKGVVFNHYDQFEQDDLGITTFPGGAQVAWFEDPSGNLLSLTQT